MSRSSFDGSVQHLIPLYRPDSGLTLTSHRNRALSIRSNRANKSSGSTGSSTRRGFSFNSLRGTVQPELSKKLFRLIKSENNLIGAHETAGRERVAIATQLSEWGEQTGDDSISDISDKVGVVLSEMGEQEDTYAHALDDSRGILKTIRNTEKSVQPSRDGKSKIADEIQRIKMKEPESAKLVVLEQELVRAEAENLVAEAQLSNIVCVNVPVFVSSLLTTSRLARNSRRPMQQNSLPPSSGRRSKSSLPSTDAGSWISWTTLPLCQEIHGQCMSTLPRLARFSTTARTT